MLKIGLTGGIGSGKSVVANFFADLGVPVIDADKIAHELTLPGQPGFEAIIEHFGADCLANDQQLDRKKLRSRVFKDPSARQWLEAMLHPLIFAAIAQQSVALTSPYCIIIIPLLIETNAINRVDRILIVDCPETVQIARTLERDHQSNIEEVKAILASQSTREQRLQAANDIIYNNGSLPKLAKAVHALHKQYLKLIKNHGRIHCN